MKGKARSGKLDTYIGDETSFEGNLTSRENVSIYGGLKGKIECQGRVIIGESGNIEADIFAGDAIVSGKVVGNVAVKGKLEITSTGILQGDIKTSRLIIEDGSRFNGRCEMTLDEKTVDAGKMKGEETPQVIASKEKPKLLRAFRG